MLDSVAYQNSLENHLLQFLEDLQCIQHHSFQQVYESVASKQAVDLLNWLAQSHYNIFFFNYSFVSLQQCFMNVNEYIFQFLLDIQIFT